jgi:hypothetical protein
LRMYANHPGKYQIKFNDAGAVTSVDFVKDEWGKMTDEQLAEKMVSGRPEEKIKAKNIMDVKQKYKIAGSASTINSSEPFGSWAQSDKEWWFQNRKDTGESPRFGFGDKKSYSQFNREYAQWNQKQGTSGAEAKTSGEEFKASSKSLANQQKVYDMMGSFVKNLDFQVERFDDIASKIKRLDARILNVPLRNAAMMIKGSANESELSMYITDISNDAAKLSTGSSASVAELSQSAQERWNKIHDLNLPIKDLIAVVKETRTAAHGRTKTAQDQINETINRMKKGSGTQAEPSGDDPLGLR